MNWAIWLRPSMKWQSDLAEFRRTNIGEVVRAKNTLEATLEALPDAVVLLDAAGRIQSMNRAARRVLASAGLDRPHRLADLRLDGLDLDTVAEAVATGASMAPPADLARTIRIEQGGSVQRLLPRVVPVHVALTRYRWSCPAAL